MTDEDVQSLASEALKETSAKHLEVSFVFQRELTWIILLSRGDEEWVVKVPTSDRLSAEAFKDAVAQEVRRLF